MAGALLRHVGVGRDLDAESGSGAEMYVVIGMRRGISTATWRWWDAWSKRRAAVEPATRQRGDGLLCKNEKPLPIKSIRVAADVPAAERSNLEVIRTDTPAFAALVESRRNRPEDFFKTPAGRIDLCNVPIAVREAHAH